MTHTPVQRHPTDKLVYDRVQQRARAGIPPVHAYERREFTQMSRIVSSCSEVWSQGETGEDIHGEADEDI